MHRVRDRRNDGVRALKILRNAPDPRRLEREIEATGRVDHPHVLPLLEGLCLGADAYLLLPLAEGSLETRIRDRGLLLQNWRHLTEACEGVAALHAAGIVHRDLKPSNLLLVEGRVRVADLGLARGADLGTITQAGIIAGTPAYMAPDQIQGGTPTPAWDTFALGILLWECLYQRLPYAHTRAADLLAEVCRGSRITLLDDTLSRPAAEVVEALLDPDPGKRPRDLGAVAATLRADPPRTSSRTPTSPLPLPGRLESSGAGSPPSTLRRRRIGSRSSHRLDRPRRRLPLLPVLLSFTGALLAAEALRRTTTTPGPASTTAPGPREDPRSDAWLNEEWAARVRGEVRELEAAPPRELRMEGELLRDPRHIEGILQQISSLKPLYAWFQEGGRPEDLPDGALDHLRSANEAFREVGMPRPFTHFLETTPLYGEDLEIPYPPGATAQTFTLREGWAGRALQEAANAQAIWTGKIQALQAARQGGPEEGIPPQLLGRGLATFPSLVAGHRFLSEPHRVSALFHSLPSRGARMIDDWLEPATRPFRRALFAMGRAAAEEDVTDQELQVFRGLMNLSQGILDSHVGALPLHRIFGRSPENPFEAWVGAVLMRLGRQGLQEATYLKPSPSLRKEEIRLWKQALGLGRGEKRRPHAYAWAMEFLFQRLSNGDQSEKAELLPLLEGERRTLRELPDRDRSRILARWLDFLNEKEEGTPRPFARKLRGWIRELRRGHPRGS